MKYCKHKAALGAAGGSGLGQAAAWDVLMHPKQGSGSKEPAPVTAAALGRSRQIRRCVRGPCTLPGAMLVYESRGWHRSAADAVTVIGSLAQEANGAQARKTSHLKHRHEWACLPSQASIPSTLS